ncbi:transcriptional regulator [Streptomyces sp. NBC_01803]|uniref:transcriptional regulator n=1 Tax=Streptomyces sp. NBC_01803 TaxID=2975946 RepID=UPI002DD8890C|nr:transcriptional regulator [Streptomyces sp. NBC_01803]WSA44796.1 DUF4388 domain-containing protein [Streptomyces sp. NBC_01803]
MTGEAAPTLDRLAAEQATGALLRDTGTLYFADGQVVHAESPATPGIDVLLLKNGRLPAERWRMAIDEAGARCQVGRFLVDNGHLGSGELEICHLNTLFDAAYFALAPGGGPARFRRGVRHWLGPVRPVRAESVERENRRRRELLARLWPYPQIDMAPVVRRPVAGAAVLSQRQRAVLALTDGVRTPNGIAWVLGRPAFHTLVDVRRLAAAGHIETPRAPAPQALPPRPAHVPDVFADPTPALLRRLRDALEATL